MKKSFLLFVFGGVLLMTAGEAVAVVSKCFGVACAMDYDPINSVPSNCASYTDYCYSSGSNFSGAGGVRVYNCTQCNTGYKLNGFTVEVDGCSNAVEANDCMLDCTGCSNCTSDTTWSAAGTGYQKKVTRTCSCNTCNASTAYRCAAGYYGSSTNGTSGCTRCPSSGGVYGTSVAGSTEITSCYIPAGDVSWTDSAGTYVCGEDSYYAK